MAKVQFEYNGETFPFVVDQEDGWENLCVLIPEPTGDYFLAYIDSFGKYTLIEEVGQDEVSVIVVPN